MKWGNEKRGNEKRENEKRGNEKRGNGKIKIKCFIHDDHACSNLNRFFFF